MDEGRIQKKKRSRGEQGKHTALEENSEQCALIGSWGVEKKTGKLEKVSRLGWSQSANARLRRETGELRPPDVTPQAYH